VEQAVFLRFQRSTMAPTAIRLQPPGPPPESRKARSTQLPIGVTSVPADSCRIGRTNGNIPFRFAAWDLAFHCVTRFVLIDTAELRQWAARAASAGSGFKNPNGENCRPTKWAFRRRPNPPVHAWRRRCRVISRTDRDQNAAGDLDFPGTGSSPQACCLTFTWFVNREDPQGFFEYLSGRNSSLASDNNRRFSTVRGPLPPAVHQQEPIRRHRLDCECSASICCGCPSSLTSRAPVYDEI